MPRGDKSAYTVKQKRMARKIEEGYEERGVGPKRAARIAWSTVNKIYGGGEKSGSGRGKPANLKPARKGGRIGVSSQSSSKRSQAARKGWEIRRRRGQTSGFLL